MPFELVTFPGSPEADSLLAGRPEDLRAFYVHGVPKSFISARYRAASTLTIAVDAEGKRLIKFGSTILDGSMCVDPGTGEVVQLVGKRSNRLPVNSSLRAFTVVVDEVCRAFPFYPGHASEIEIRTAAERVADIVRRNDAEAAEPDRYWSTFVDDMLMGDLSTGDVLAILSAG